jgi:hypothetical protein
MTDEINRKNIASAIKAVLELNYRYKFINLFIKPSSVEWHIAVCMKNDELQRWAPRVIIYNDISKEVGIWQGLEDTNPILISASTIMTMAEEKIIQPKKEK